MNLQQFWSPCQGAVSLTFDDGTKNQLEKAVPLLDEYQVKATFYLNPAQKNWQEQIQQWSAVSAAGHEIGNHTLSHLCSNNILGKHGGLEDRNLADIETDILAAQTLLAQVAPRQKDWSFAYPCYNTAVGRSANQQSYVPLVARHFLAGRSGGEYGIGNHPQQIDLAAVWGIPAERMSGFELIGLIEELTFQGRWVILVFHAISGDRLSVSLSDFEMLLRYLRRKRKIIRTAPVVEIARKIKIRQLEDNNIAS